MWQSKSYEQLLNKAYKLARINVNQQFIALELLSYIKQQKIIRPQYTTLQNIVIAAINAEKSRINKLIMEQVSPDETKLILALIRPKTKDRVVIRHSNKSA